MGQLFFKYRKIMPEEARVGLPRAFFMLSNAKKNNLGLFILIMLYGGI